MPAAARVFVMTMFLAWRHAARAFAALLLGLGLPAGALAATASVSIDLSTTVQALPIIISGQPGCALPPIVPEYSYGQTSFTTGTTAGNHVFEVTGLSAADDPAILLYQGAFDPANPETNLIACEDTDGFVNPVLFPRLVVSLPASTAYTVVVVTPKSAPSGSIVASLGLGLEPTITYADRTVAVGATGEFMTATSNSAGAKFYTSQHPTTVADIHPSTGALTIIGSGTTQVAVLQSEEAGLGIYGSGVKEATLTVTGAASPTITSATYDAATGVLAVTATGMTAGDTIDPTKLTLTGEGGTTYTLTTGNVTASSATSFSVTLNATDRAAVNPIANKNGMSSTGATTYNLAAAANWNVTASASADPSGNAVTVSNVAAPAITSATYDGSTGTLAVTGTGFLVLGGAANDVVASRFTLTGHGGGTYTLTDTANVEITSGTAFTLVLSATDKAAVNALLNNNGTSSLDATTYNLAAAEDWAAGADAAVTVADFTGNGITVSNATPPTYAITKTASPAAGGTITCTPDPVSHGASSSCSAIGNPGYTFTGFSGDCTGMTCSLANVTGPRSVTAHFMQDFCFANPCMNGGTCTSGPTGYTCACISGFTGAQCETAITYPITEIASPAAGGTLSCSPNPVSHGGSSTCTATANPGYTLAGYSGDCTGTGANCTLVAVTSPKSVTATFTPVTYPITMSVSPAAGGTISCAPNPVSHGGSATCTATASAGYVFSTFSGDCTGTSCSLTNVTSAKSVTAVFTHAFCSAGFYGPSCTACPSCGNGYCDDGLTGSGICICNPGFVGATCSTCAAGYEMSGGSCIPVVRELRFSTQPAGATAGQPFTTQPVVTVVDGAGNVDVTRTDTVTLEVNPTTATTGGVNVTCSPAAAVAVAGRATFSGCSIGKAGSFNLTARAGALEVDSARLVVEEVKATKLAILQAPSNLQVGQRFTLSVAAQDAFGNTMPSHTGLATITTLSALRGALTTAFVNGVATFYGLYFSTASGAGDPYVLTVSSWGLTPANTPPITVTAVATATRLTILDAPSTVKAGQKFGFSVVAQDASGTTVPNFTGNVVITAFSNGNSGVLRGTTTVPAVNGVASVSGLYFTHASREGDPYRMTATASLLTSASTPVTVTSNPPLAPTNLLVVPGDRQAVMSWDEPAGAPYQRYEASRSIEGSTTWDPVGSRSTARKITVVGTNGQRVRFRVRAVNDEGLASDYVESGFVTLGAAPGAPGKPTVSVGDQQVTVSWAIPEGADPDDFVVSSSPPGAGCTSAFRGRAITTYSCVAQVPSEGSYTFTVTARNSVGTGPASAPSDPVFVFDADPIHGACGHLAQLLEAEVTGPVRPLCERGTATEPVANGEGWTWTCQGANGGGTRQCTAHHYVSMSIFSSIKSGVGCRIQRADVATVEEPQGPGAAIVMPYGALGFELTRCEGGVANVEISHAGIVEGMQFWKELNGAWMQLTPANSNLVVRGDKVSFTIVDNGPLDADPQVGVISDPGGVGYFALPPVPAAPVSATATAGDASATVSWTPPAGGGAAVRYRVTASNGGATCTALAPASSCTVAGLTNGIAYAFTVVAENAGGLGQPSAPTAVVTPGATLAPAQPTGVRAMAVGTDLLVMWSAPTSGGTPIRYVATAEPGGRTCEAFHPATSCTITGLTPGVAYTVTVVAVNALGPSPSVAASSHGAVAVPTLSEWAMILLVLTMMGMAWTNRRRVGSGRTR